MIFSNLQNYTCKVLSRDNETLLLCSVLLGLLAATNRSSIVKIPPKVLDRFVDGSMGATRNRSIREPNQLNLIELDYSFYLNG